jgi:undecaprenyl-diphosphatase
MSNFWQVVLLGVVEGITEFLPISSTGHLLIVEQFVGRRSDTFNIVIQLGAILAVILIYWRRLVDLALYFSHKQNRDYVAKLAVAFGITVAGGLIISALNWKLPETAVPVAWALIFGGVAIALVELFITADTSIRRYYFSGQFKEPSDAVTWPMAIAAGFMQLVAAIFPGTSRSAATIIGAMFLGQSRQGAAEFSFILGIPTMLAAGVYALWRERAQLGGISGSEWQSIGIGFIVSAIVAFAAVKWLLNYIQSHTFLPFAVYRMGLGVALLLYFQFGK